jgi:hypothetical protein
MDCDIVRYHLKEWESNELITGMDECQLAVNPRLIPLKFFNNEEDYKLFINTWEGEQLGDKTETRDGRICIAMPNPISQAVSEAIVLAEKEVNLKVNLGISYVVGNNWAICH